MIRWILLLFLFWAGSAQAQYWATREFCDIEVSQPDPRIFEPEGQSYWQEKSASRVNGLGRFWQVTSPEGIVSHLLGTIHSSKPSVARLPKPVLTALENSQIIMTEIDGTARNRAQAEGRTTESYISRPLRQGAVEFEAETPEVTAAINSRLISLRWGDGSAEFISDAFLAWILLSSPCEDLTMGSFPIQDSFVQYLAALQEKNFVAMEGSEDALIWMASPKNKPTTRAILNLYGSYLLPPEFPQIAASFEALHLRGDIGLMIDLDLKHARDTFGHNRGTEIWQLVTDYLVNERNDIFLKSALPYLTEAPTFMAMGSFHLPDQTGFIELLRRQGFTVERIVLEGERVN